MIPLNQWICDECGRIIEKPEDGYVIWKENERGMLCDIRIIHISHFSEISSDKNGLMFSRIINSFIGELGKARLLSFIDPGFCFVNEYQEKISNMRLFVEVFRRLQIPYYEEARMYLNDAKVDGCFEEGNELWAYLPETLKKLIVIYKK